MKVKRDILKSAQIGFNLTQSVSRAFPRGACPRQVKPWERDDVYGKLWRSSNNVQVAYRFTGQELDLMSGLYNFRARQYDGDIGIFYAADPANASTSPYGYVSGNPVSRIDPTGMIAGWVSMFRSYGGDRSGGYLVNIPLAGPGWWEGFPDISTELSTYGGMSSAGPIGPYGYVNVTPSDYYQGPVNNNPALSSGWSNSYSPSGMMYQAPTPLISGGGRSRSELDRWLLHGAVVWYKRVRCGLHTYPSSTTGIFWTCYGKEWERNNESFQCCSIGFDHDRLWRLG
jgi:RHS repeat-associated protein